MYPNEDNGYCQAPVDLNKNLCDTDRDSLQVYMKYLIGASQIFSLTLARCANRAASPSLRVQGA